MRLRRVNFIWLVLLGAVFAAGVGASAKDESPPVVLGRGAQTINGKTCSVEFVWVKGRHYTDTNDWCGSGEKYEGKFAFRVKVAGGDVVETPAGEEGDEFFLSRERQPWKIAMGDYNRDGQPDFNIVWYGSCNHDLCRLYTVLPSGKVETMKMQERDGKITGALVVVRKGEASEADLQLTAKGFCQPADVLERGAAEYYDWDVAKKIFRNRERKLVKRQEKEFRQN